MDKKVIKQSIVGLILGAIFGVSVVTMLSKATILKVLPHSPAGNVVFWASLLLGPFIALAIHELGHLLAGLVQGFRLELYIVGFLGIKRENGKVVVYLNRDVQYFGGVAATVPTKLYPDLKRRFALVVAAGPLSSLVSGLVFLMLFISNNNEFNSFWALSTLFSGAILLGTTVPSKTGVFFTDRKRFQRLMDKGHTGDVELALLQTINQYVIDNGYQNVSLDNVAIIKTDADRFVRFWGDYFEYQYYRELQNEEMTNNARTHLFDYQPDFPKAMWQSLKIE